MLDLSRPLAEAKQLLHLPVSQHRAEYRRLCDELNRGARNPNALGDQRAEAYTLWKRLEAELGSE